MAQGHAKHTKWQKQNNDKDRHLKDKDRSKTCGRCGKAMHRREEKCPTAKSACHKCKKTGHWERMCKSKIVGQGTGYEGDEDAYFLGSVDSTLSSDEQGTVHLDIGGTSISFKIDTGPMSVS